MSSRKSWRASTRGCPRRWCGRRRRARRRWSAGTRTRRPLPRRRRPRAWVGRRARPVLNGTRAQLPGHSLRSATKDLLTDLLEETDDPNLLPAFCLAVRRQLAACDEVPSFFIHSEQEGWRILEAMRAGTGPWWIELEATLVCLILAAPFIRHMEDGGAREELLAALASLPAAVPHLHEHQHRTLLSPYLLSNEGLTWTCSLPPAPWPNPPHARRLLAPLRPGHTASVGGAPFESPSGLGMSLNNAAGWWRSW